MEVTTNKVRLLEALKNALNIVKKAEKSNLICKHVLIEVDAESNKLVISATNFEEIYAEKIPAEINQPGSSVVNADKLFKILKKSKSQTVCLFSDDNYLSLDLGKLKTKIASLPGGKETFPNCEFYNLLPAFSVDPDEMKLIFEKTFMFIGENEARKNLTGLHIKNLSSGKIRFQGADAFRIADFQLPAQNDYCFDFILPKFHLQNIFKNFKDRMFFSIDRKSSGVETENQDQRYQCRLIEAEYPNLDRLLETPHNLSTASTDDIIEAVDMMETLVDKDKNAVMKVTFNETLTFETQKTEFGDGSVSIDHDYFGEEMKMGSNIYFFNDVVKIFKGYDSLDLHFEKPENALVFTTKDLDQYNYKAVLMPARIRW